MDKEKPSPKNLLKKPRRRVRCLTALIEHYDRDQAKFAMRRAMTIWEADRKDREKQWPGFEGESITP